MEASAQRPIQVLEPFNAAITWTKAVLFEPFDLAKWCVIGFAAFLAQLGSGGGAIGSILIRGEVVATGT